VECDVEETLTMTRLKRNSRTARLIVGAPLLVAVISRLAWAAATAAAEPAMVSPTDLVAQVAKGKLSNPYKDTEAEIVAQGGKLFLGYGCNGCHGGNGGGGICPPVINDVWVYGGDDDTLFRLVTLGSDQLQKLGYTRIGEENVVAPMPSFGGIIKSADDLWKILAFIRSHYDGDPAYKFGTPASAR
jgi:mono/diheme cytochrome c family protein